MTQYDDKAHAGERGVDYKYKTMPLADICALPVERLADKDSLLFMWITMPQLNVAERVMNSWDFEFKTCGFTWIKSNKKATSAMRDFNKFVQEKFDNGEKVELMDIIPWFVKLCFMGTGSHTRANPELCLIGKRGKGVPRQDKGVRSVVFSPIGEHSEKPAQVRDDIVRLCGDVPRIELFARQSVPGWDALGYDIDGKDMRTSILEKAHGLKL